MSAGTTRLQRAFEQMRRERLLVEENCACCSTCAHAHCFQLLADQPDKVGYLFYHGQDLDTAAENGRLYLGHAARPGMPDKVPPLVAVQCLADHGLQVEWSGDVNLRVQVLLPEGPERAYMQRQLDEAYEEFEEEYEVEGGSDDGDEQPQEAERTPGQQTGGAGAGAGAGGAPGT